MNNECSSCQKPFQVTKSDLEFYNDVSPIFGGQKQSIPPPNDCPNCRLQQRLMFRNDRNFYHRKSDKSGKDIVTLYSQDKPYTVYDKDEWWADDWDPLSYGRDIDFSRPFFEQFLELRLEVPRVNLFTSNTENSYYTNHALNCKNCYLIWGGGDDEDCMYGNYVIFCKDTLDGTALYSSERCYEGISSERCYNCLYFLNCRDCTDCIMVEECTSCSHCIGCFGLYKKQYCMFNQQLTQQEWEKRRKELQSLTPQKVQLLRERLTALKKDAPHRASHIFASENCTGDGIYNSRNCYHCFDIKDCEDCKYVMRTPKGIRSYDCTYTAPHGLELSYFNQSSLGGQQILFCFLCYNCNDILYSQECHFSQNIFGCSGLRHNQYCILNKQYSEEEYNLLSIQLIEHMKQTGEWGSFFPPSDAPIAYNESNAHDFFPLTKEQAIKRGSYWYDAPPVKESGIPIESIPNTIEEVDEKICDKVFTCEVSGKQYKINKQELSFYKEMGIALPRRHCHQRQRDRLDVSHPRQLWARKCTKCSQEIQTTYSPERPERVYCEECYLSSI